MSSEASFLSERVAPPMIRYSNMTPLSFQGNQQLKHFFPSNQSTYSQSNNIIRIAISSSSAFLDGGNSYLKLDFQNNNATANTTYTFSNSYHSLIERVRIVASSGAQIEDIMYYNQLHAYLSDVLLSSEKRQTRLQEGYSQAIVGNAVVASTPFVSGDNIIANITAGITASLNSLTSTITYDPTSVGCSEMSVAQTTSTTVYIPLELSQLVGSNKKLLPLFLTGELQLEITLAARPCMVSSITSPLTFEVSNVSYCSSMVEFSGGVNQALTAMVQQGGLHLHSTCWSNQKVTLTANQRSFVNSERLKSVKSILIGFTDDNLVQVNKRVTNRQTNEVTSLQIKIGSDYYPPQPIKATSTNPKSCGFYLNEVYKALGVYNDSNHSSMVNIYNFSDSTQALRKVGRAVYGFDLDSFGKSDVESGISTIISNPITVEMEGSAGNLAALTYLLYDCIFSITPDGQFICSK